MSTPEKPDISIDAADLDLDTDESELAETSKPDSADPLPGSTDGEADRQSGGAG